MCVPTSVGESLHIDEDEETEVSTDLILRTEIDYRQARTREAYRSSRKINRVRRPKTPSERVA